MAAQKTFCMRMVRQSDTSRYQTHGSLLRASVHQRRSERTIHSLATTVRIQRTNPNPIDVGNFNNGRPAMPANYLVSDYYPHAFLGAQQRHIYWADQYDVKVMLHQAASRSMSVYSMVLPQQWEPTCIY